MSELKLERISHPDAASTSIEIAASGAVSFSNDIAFDTNTFYVDTANGRVGIGTTSPSTTLQIEDTSGNPTFSITSSTSGASILQMGDTADLDAGKIQYTNSTNNMIFTVAASEAMRIDSSGNLLVGKTSSNLGTVGIEVKPTQLYVTNDAAPGAIFNVLNSDSDVLQIRKDSATLGVIGTTNSSTNMFVSGTRNSQSAGIEFGTDAYLPMRDESRSDASVNFGSATWRYKDLYLSGGVYLGGTGSANKLDDYEEGTWTPAIASGTINVTHAVYTKIGNTVFVSVRIENPSDTTSSTEVEISGLPFASTSGNASTNALFYRYFTHSCTDLVAYKGAGNIFLYQSFSNNQNWVTLKHSSFNTGADFYFSISYQTDA